MFSNIFSGLPFGDLPVNRESASYITGTWVSALRENTTYHIEHKPKSKAAPLRTVCSLVPQLAVEIRVRIRSLSGGI